MIEHTHPTPNAHLLRSLVQTGDLDAAIEAGLLDFSAPKCGDLPPNECALLLATCTRLRKAQEARERFCARKARLQRREQERRARRVTSLPAQTSSSHRPALPAAAAAVLARARERAGIEPK